ncbi:MAG: hypothetical protein VKL39_11195 [Leptolyngbyaceae bacterium]|nr:hypothetical protein [Leptolyngbyaceae bacterium]
MSRLLPELGFFFSEQESALEPLASVESGGKASALGFPARRQESGLIGLIGLIG